MTKFPIVETAFAGYRLLAKRPGVAAVWFLFQLTVALFTTYLTVTMIGPQVMAMNELKSSGTPDPATMMTLTGQILPFSILSILLAILAGAILSAAVLRAVLRPAQSRFGYLRFGADELRLVLLSLVIGFFLVLAGGVFYMAASIVLMVVAGGPQAMVAAMQGQGSLPVAAMLSAGAVGLPGVALFLFLYVKFSLAGAQTVGERAIRIFGSWRLTRGIFWRTLFAYLLAAIPAALGMAALAGLSMALKPEGFSGNWMEASQPDVSSLAAAFSGTQVVLYVLQALLAMIYSAALLVPAAVIYMAVSGHTPPLTTVDDDEDEDDDED